MLSKKYNGGVEKVWKIQEQGHASHLGQGKLMARKNRVVQALW